MNGIVDLLTKYGARVVSDSFLNGAYVVTFPFENALTTIRIILHDTSGADLAITNMTTLPESAQKHGFGSRAVQSVLAWATQNGLTDIRAFQVQSVSEHFWAKNKFERMPEPNPCNDFIYRTEA
jgi:hypothetical protein